MPKYLVAPDHVTVSLTPSGHANPSFGFVFQEESHGRIDVEEPDGTTQLDPEEAQQLDAVLAGRFSKAIGGLPLTPTGDDEPAAKGQATVAPLHVWMSLTPEGHLRGDAHFAYTVSRPLGGSAGQSADVDLDTFEVNQLDAMVSAHLLKALDTLRERSAADIELAPAPAEPEPAALVEEPIPTP